MLSDSEKLAGTRLLQQQERGATSWPRGEPAPGPAGPSVACNGLCWDARRLAAANTNPRVPITEWSVIWEDGCIIVPIGATQGPLRVHELSSGNAG